MRLISAYEVASVLAWDQVLEALHTAHLGARPSGDSFFLGDAQYGLLSRGVILPGLGAGLKIASICPANRSAHPSRPAEDAVFIVVDEVTKAIRAVLDGPEITRWKTAADSAVAARMLSRQDSSVLLVLGAGPISRALIDAYLHIRPAITKVLLWNRTPTKLVSTLRELEAKGIGVEIVQDLASASREADIISSATCSAVPLIEGRSVKPGTHVDLVGGFRPDMQEADIELMRRARIFVGDRSTAYASGDIGIPLASGAVTEAQIEGDLYELCQNDAFRRGPQDITVYKNAGGAHFDLIISQLVIRLLTYGTTAGCH